MHTCTPLYLQSVYSGEHFHCIHVERRPIHKEKVALSNKKRDMLCGEGLKMTKREFATSVVNDNDHSENIDNQITNPKFLFMVQ